MLLCDFLTRSDILQEWKFNRWVRGHVWAWGTLRASLHWEGLEQNEITGVSFL